MRLRRRRVFLLAGGLAACIVGPLLIPVPPLKDVHPPRELADNDSQFIQLNELDIHVKKYGQGDLVFVLLHGFAASLYTWQAIVQPLSGLGVVITYDRPGFGLSARPLEWQGQNPYGTPAQLQLVTALLDHFGVRQAVLVGHSAGGSIALQYALAHPERVGGLVLIDPAIYHSGGPPGWLHALLTTPQMRHLGPLFTRLILYHGRQLIRQAWHDPNRLTLDMEDYYLKPTRVENWDKALWEFTLASRPPHLPGHLEELTLPVLVVTGNDDRIVPMENSIRLARELRTGSLKIIQDAGHLPHEEQPQEFMQAMKGFISKLSTRESPK